MNKHICHQFVATRMLSTYTCVCLTSALLIFSTSAIAANQGTETLRQSVTDFLQAQTKNQPNQDIEISVGRIDRRLKLTACQKSPEAFLPAGATLHGKLTVGVRCVGPKPWTVYVPAQIKIFANIITASQQLLRGTEIRADNLMSVRQEIGKLRSGYFTKPDAVIGKVLKQNIAAGHAITPKRIKSRILVHRGEKVTIVASIGALKVRGKGKALKDAAQGELVSVRNSRSKRIVQGIVTKPGTVNVQM